ncbi:hypothetical protein PTTG_28160 [Puccinia triticina 1-1 BBBD Race 1]|uniref:CCHC-type domain-containing protein n=1 Tax=Puccinia triticina (isolate 1-1 / race 1 (BBBD)) TaxID=630390 RepID=A0A180GDS2_PUCT1|nr:hypothetical protein PTTG_28160 [Puccinia triticina 1-1 BBBD Race 1]
MKSLLGPQISTTDYFRKRLNQAPAAAGPSHNGPSSFFGLDKGKGRDLSEEPPEETTFQPRITGQTIGSSPPDNFAGSQSPAPENRASKHQTGVQLDLANLVNELHLQRQSEEARRQDDRARKDAEEARMQARWSLDEDSKISSIISAAVKDFAAEDLLKPNGSNIRQWEQALRTTAAKRFRNADFFTPGEDKAVIPYHEKIALGIIQSSVHSELSFDLLDFDNSADVFAHLISKFRIINRARKLQAWEKLKSISLSDYNSAAEVLAEFNQCARTFVEQGVDLTWDAIRSFVLQGNLRDHLRSTVDQKVDLFMETHDSMAPGPIDILPSRAETSVSGDVSGPVSGASSESQDAGDISAMAINKTPRCYICKKLGHMSSSCPTSRKNNSDACQPLQQAPANPSFPPCSATYNFDRLPYIKPIQPDHRPTGASPAPYQPPHLSQPKTANPTHTTKQVNTRQINADLFAEEEDEVEYVLENENLYALFDFKTLEQPIAVKVATDTACDFITGTGTLRFCAMNGVTVAVKKVYYSTDSCFFTANLTQ